MKALWPLYLVYVRPAFRAGDWRAYEEVNAKFAEVVAAESNTDNPVILIQDLLSRCCRSSFAQIPKATIALFWHIPWPNAETFGVCPEARDAAPHAVGGHPGISHTRYHC
jgi:trehalose 6-phosphate synthase